MWGKYFLLGCMACVFMMPGYATATESSPKVPQAFLPERVFEFQPVLEGTQVVHEFVLKNKGEAPLNILQIKSG